MLKKIMCTFLSIIIIAGLAATTAFAALEEYPESYTEFRWEIDGTTREYKYDDIGINDRNYQCGVSGATYLVTCHKKNLIGSSQVGGTWIMPTNTNGATYCARWTDVNTSGNGKFYFHFKAQNNQGPENSYGYAETYWIYGWTKPLSEE